MLPLNRSERICLLLAFASTGCIVGAYQVQEWRDMYWAGGTFGFFILATLWIRLATGRERKLIAYSKELLKRSIRPPRA